MELRQLRYFCAVAEELSFARAARRLFIAQPALSVQIRRLEEELGARLLERTTRMVKLTHAGRTFYAEASDILVRAGVAARRAKEAERGVIGVLRVAVLSNAGTADLGRRMRLFREKFPGVNLRVLEAPAHRQMELLLQQEIDLGVFRIARPRGRSSADIAADLRGAAVGLPSPEIATAEIGRETMVVAAPADSVLARKKRLEWKDLNQQPMILTSDTRERYFDPFLACCHRHGVQPVVAQHAQELMTRLWLVACGYGFTPTSQSSQELVRPGLVYRPLPADGPEVLTIAAWRKMDREPHLTQFVQTLRSAKVR